MPISSYKNISPKIDATAYIDTMAVVIGDVVIAEHVSVWPMAVIRGDVNKIRIGANTNIQDGSVLHVTTPSEFFADGFDLIIGAKVTIGHKAVLHGCHIADNCLIGMGAVIMDGASIGANTMVASGSVVTPNKQLEGGYLWLGSPARKVRALNEKELAFLEYSQAHYVKLKQDYML